MEASITQAEKFLNEHLRQIVISGPRGSQEASKIRIRPLLLQKELKFQAEEQRGNQVFHRNMSREETMEYLRGAMSGAYRQMELQSEQGTMHVLVSKSGKQTVKIRSRAAAADWEAFKNSDAFTQNLTPTDLQGWSHDSAIEGTRG